jgi:hypothetical protein
MQPDNLLLEILTADELCTLCSVFGGCDLYVPSDPGGARGMALSERIGSVVAAKLIQWARGSKLYIPMPEDHLKRRRDDIKRMRASGMTVAEISRSYRFPARYSERQIIRLISDP